MTRQPYMTTREVAALLRVKERKIYDLVSAGVIPVSRVTGKLLFPLDMVELWMRSSTEYGDTGGRAVERPPVLAGSHDPLLEWALRESGSGIATFFDGSLDGLERLAHGRALAAGLHVHEPDSGDFNRATVRRWLPGMPVVQMVWAKRSQGLVLPAGNPHAVRSLADLAGKRFVPRQRTAGSHLLFMHLGAAAGLDLDTLDLVAPPARSETDVALAVASGKARAGFAIEAVARQHGLDFVALAEERYDLVIWRREVFEPPLQRLLAFCSTAAFAEHAAELGGYAVESLGEVCYNGP